MKINGSYIPKYSELTTLQFCKVTDAEVSSLPEYFSLFSGLTIEELMSSDFDTPSKPYLFSRVFDVDIEKVIRTKKETINYKGETYIVDSLSFKTFGKAYLFDIYHQKHKEGLLSSYELFVYAIAIAMSNHSKLSDVEDIKKELFTYKWVNVLPQAFFLAKKFLKRQRFSQLQLIRYTLELKETSMRIRLSLRNLQKSEMILS